MWRSPLPSSSCVVIALLLLAHAAQHAAPSPVAGLPSIVFSAAFAAGGADQPLLRTPKRNGEEEDHRRENDRQDDAAAACLRGPYPGETPGHATAAAAARGGVDRGDRRLTTASSARENYRADSGGGGCVERPKQPGGARCPECLKAIMLGAAQKRLFCAVSHSN